NLPRNYTRRNESGTHGSTRTQEEGGGMKRTFFNELEQGTDEWLQARCGIVTASTMRSLVTASGKPADNDTSRGFVRQLATERIIGVPEFTYPTRPMQRGNLLEPHARELYAEHYAPVDEVGFIRLDTDEYSLGYSPDGLVGHDGLVEFKSPGPKEHLRTILADEVPAVYKWQVQVGLFFTGRSWIDFCSYCPGMQFRSEEHTSELQSRFDLVCRPLLANK